MAVHTGGLSGLVLMDFEFPKLPVSGWHTEYIGRPYEWGGADPLRGWDCWGLHCFCLAEHYGVRLPWLANLRAPELATARRDRDKATAAAFETMADGAIKAQRLDRPVPGAGILFNVHGRPLHLGHYVGNGWFLHVDRKTPTCLEQLSSPQWEKRIEGFYVPA